MNSKKENPLTLEKISFTSTIESDDVNEEDIQKVISLAEQISPVWLAIKNNVKVEYQYQIIKR